MSEKPSVGVKPDELDELEPDEMEELEELRADERYMEELTKDKQKNYAMLRKLRPVADHRSLAVMELANPDDKHYFESLKMLAQFKDWKVVEGGEIQVRESEDVEDSHGYIVVRPKDDEVHEIVIRVWNGFSNSAIILPRSDQPLPHHGKQKEEILEQMRLISGKELDAYNVWLERLRKAA